MTLSNDPRSALPPQAPAPLAPTDPSAPVWMPQPALEPVQAAAPAVVAPPSAAAPARRRGGGGSTAILLVGAIVLVGGLAFAAGRVTAPATTSRASAFAGQGAGGYGTAGGQASGGATGAFRAGGLAGAGLTVEGTVSAVTAGGITLDVNGTSTQVATDSSTTYHSQGAATAADVAVGSKVLVRVNGFGGGFGGRPGTGVPGASPAPGASAAPGAAGGSGGAAAGGTQTLTATDVTIAAQ